MTPTLRVLSIIAVLTLLAAASSAQAQDAASSKGRFTGSLRGSGVIGGGDATRYSGSVEITPTSSTAGAWRVEIKLSSGGGGGSASMLQWSISPGRCGSRVQQLLAPSGLPQLEVRSGGSADLRFDGAITLDEKASYQLVVYGNGQNQQDIVACANLKYAAPKP